MSKVYKNTSFKKGFKPSIEDLKKSHGKMFNAKELKEVHELLHSKEETSKKVEDGKSSGTSDKS